MKLSPVLEVKNLTIRFNTRDGQVRAVNDISFDLYESEFLGIVGESGSGKSVAMMSLLKLLPMPPSEIVSGQVLFENNDLISLDKHALQRIRGGRIGFIFQDPMTSLNPVLTIGYQITESLCKHLGMSRSQARKRAVELLQLVGITSASARFKNYPHELSGGMRQRVMIAIALACEPKILIADEPTTALDVTIQAQILDLIKDLRRSLDMSVIWISHDLGVVAGLVDRVMVMYAGYIVERAHVNRLYEQPKHPYTSALLDTLPRLDNKQAHRLNNIKGQPPDMLSGLNKGCPFAPRCIYTHMRCNQEKPPLLPILADHEVACWWDIDKGVPRE